MSFGPEVVLRNSGGTPRRMEPTIRESIEVMPGPSSAFRPATIIVPEPDQSAAIAELEMKYEKELQILRNTIADLESEVDRLKREKLTLEHHNSNVQMQKFQTHLEKESKVSKNDKYSWQKFLLQFKLFNRPSKEQLQKKNILKGRTDIFHIKDNQNNSQ